MILFVYGTLRRGQHNHHLIADQDFLGDAATEPRYRVTNLGAYPGMVEVEVGEVVSGELYRVSDCCLDELDDFEGVPHLFRRGIVYLKNFDQSAEAYFYNRTLPS